MTANIKWNRRGFIRFLGIAGLSVGPLASMACSGSSSDGDGDDPGGKADGWGTSHNDKTMNALFNVFIPTDGEESVGAVEAGALRLFRSSVLLKAAVEIGAMPAGDDGESPADYSENTIVAALDLASPSFGAADFLSLSDEQRILLVQFGYANPVNRGYLELARSAALWAYFGACFNDLGFRAMGVEKYEDFTGRWHNQGYPDSCPDEVPSVNGQQVWNIEMD
ncbi:MAG: twin-arginine translocation signal domain-containing protein [Kofleriaceae bacterium]